MNRNITEELIKSANQIREKYRALKRGKFTMEEQRMEELKPILEPLHKLVEDKPLPIMNQETTAISKPNINPARTPIRTPSRIPALQAYPIPPSLQFGLIASKYLSKYLSTNSETDKTYGIRTDDGKFYIGNQEVQIANDDIMIGDKTFVGTDGLWQLLTMKKPENYGEEDLANYKEILLLTSAHKKGYKPDEPISSNRGDKYMGIIKQLFSTTGEGLSNMRVKEVTGNKIDYVYWDDPNEMVNRLRLLILSRSAGNTGVQNEIESILEELTEAGIILK